MADKDRPQIIGCVNEETTQTIDLDSLFTPDITLSGSYDLGGVQATTLGKLLNSLPMPTLLVDTTHCIIFANEAWGTKRSDTERFEGMLFSSLFPYPEASERLKSLMETAFADRKPQVNEIRLTIGKRRIWGRMHLRSVRMGKQRYVLVIIQDFTLEKQQLMLSRRLSDELREAHDKLEKRVEERTATLWAMNRQLKEEIQQRTRFEEELRLSEDRYRTLVEDSFDGIFVHEEGRMVFANSRLYEMLGYTSDELEGRDHRDICHPDDWETFVQWSLLSVTGAYQPQQFDLRLLRKDGTAIDVELNARVVQFGGSPGVRVCVRDIADRKRTEELLLQTERTKAIAEMAGGVAHNFNNLLQIVMGGAQLASSLLKSTDAEAIQRNLDRILESARFGAETVKRLQDFARVRSSETIEGAEVFDLSSTVEQAVKATEPWWKTHPEKRGVKIALHVAPGSGCLVNGKENELFEVSVNVIKNAVEALPDGGQLTIDTFAREGSVFLRVRDNGVGILEQDMRKAFQPFWTTKGFQGTGMGLASSLGIVRRHKGQISLDSKKGEGTTVTVSLPLSMIPMRDQVPGLNHGIPSGLKILVIDDMEQTVNLLQEGFSQCGHEAFTALSGREGLETFNQNRVDAVICDLGMPDMNGWQVAAEIKAICGNRGEAKLPFILLTGWGGQLTESSKMAECGVDRIVEKPVDFPRLLEVIAELTL